MNTRIKSTQITVNGRNQHKMKKEIMFWAKTQSFFRSIYHCTSSEARTTSFNQAMLAGCGLHYVIVLASLLLSCSPFLCAQIQNYSSTAYLSTSWINNASHSIGVNGTDNSNKMTPILVSGHGLPTFYCGFYCNNNSSSECVFGILISGPEFSELVWSANRNNPVQYNATLQLGSEGDLVLANSDGSSVWSSNTGGKSVAGLNLTEMGNLVLFGTNNESIWQSFDHPTDSLLLGQKLSPRQQLRASASESNWSQGRYYLSVGSDGLSAYVDSNPPQRYSVFGYNGHAYYEFNNGSFNDFAITPGSAAQLIKFGPDGQLNAYEWFTGGYGKSALLYNVSDCGYPMVCGNYGVCSKGPQCSCIETTTGNASFFSQIDFRQPNIGCSLATPISCDHSQDHTLMELNNTYYFAFESNLKEELISMEECKNACQSNCSCKAVLFVIDPSASESETNGSCLLVLNEVFSIINNDDDYYPYNATLFVKVQNAHVKTSKRKAIILASTFGVFFGVLCVIGSCLVLLRRIFKDADKIDGSFLDQVPGMPTRYSHENLKAATKDFSEKVGEGGFGSVYEGVLSNGTKIAVKCLDGLAQVKDTFLVEVKAIGSINHVHLVKLLGFCFEKSHWLLVYEYMANGSLDRWIFSGKKNHSLPWHTRRKIFSAIAKGLAYLHEDCSQKIIHFDIKPQNILLDQNFNAKVSDFGLSKLIEKGESRVVTRMRGTPGYLAPEWLSSVITEKVDVYSFGIMIMEILCGRKNLDWSKIEEDRHLLSVFKRKAKDEKLQDMIDKENPDMLIHVQEAVDMMKVAAWCLQSNFKRRPSMSLVVKVLEGLVAAETNLDYDFMNSSAVGTGAASDEGREAVDHISCPQLPSTLSGPR